MQISESSSVFRVGSSTLECLREPRRKTGVVRVVAQRHRAKADGVNGMFEVQSSECGMQNADLRKAWGLWANGREV
jgi:hypothetical protein